MKKAFLLFLIPVLALAQKKEIVYKKVAALTCECATNKGVQKLTETDLGLCELRCGICGCFDFDCMR